MLGFILLGAGFQISLWWDFPGDWQLLEGVTENPAADISPESGTEAAAHSQWRTLHLPRTILYPRADRLEFTRHPSRDASHCPATTSLLPIFAAR